MSTNDSTHTSTRRNIFVGAKASPPILDAVVDGGGTPVPTMADATAIIWTGGDLDQLEAGVHGGIEWVQLPSAGVEQYVARGFFDGGFVATNAGPAYAGTVSEHTLALLLACARRIPQLSRTSTWAQPRIDQLRGSTVAIIGCGRIGVALIELLAPFDVEVLASTRSGKPIAGVSTVVTPDRHGEILADADYVVLAAPATAQTAQLIGRDELAVMKESAYLVNIARGSLIDTDALVDAVSDGTIAGAALDVTDPEPLPDGHPLWDLESVLITPHIANPDAWDAEQLSRVVRKNVERYLRGEDLLGVVDPKLGY